MTDTDPVIMTYKVNYRRIITLYGIITGPQSDILGAMLPRIGLHFQV